MRRYSVVLFSVWVGCAGSSPPAAGGRPQAAVDVQIPPPPAGPDRIERQPRPRAPQDHSLRGTWRFVHGGERWFTAHIKRTGVRWTADIVFNDDISWVKFEIERMTVPPEGSDRIILLVGVDGDEERREITLRGAASDGRLEGSVEGSSYTEPFPVVATRIH